jgi:hypothetical protein
VQVCYPLLLLLVVVLPSLAQFTPLYPLLLLLLLLSHAPFMPLYRLGPDSKW